jgi:hypothetical protein
MPDHQYSIVPKFSFQLYNLKELHFSNIYQDILLLYKSTDFVIYFNL